MLDDVIDSGSGLELVEVAPVVGPDGRTARVPAGATLVAAIRDGQRVAPSALDPDHLDPTDRLVVLRDAEATSFEP